MTGHVSTWDGLQHSPVIIVLPALVAAVLVLLLGAYAWRRRSLPGALPFACMMVLTLLWLLTDVLEVAAAGVATKVFWFRLQTPLEIGVFTAELVFAVEYAYAGRLTSRRSLLLLAIVPVAAFALTLTNPAHHLLWGSLEVRRTVHPVRGSGVWGFVAYAGMLSALTASVFLWLFVRGPRQRRPIALCLCAVIVVRLAWVVETTGAPTFGPLGHSTGRTAIAATFAFALYAIALFRYRMLDVLSIARDTVIEQIRDGIVVLDSNGVILDVNPAAEATFGLTAAQLVGSDVRRILPAGSGLERIAAGAEHDEVEFGRPDGTPARQYAVERTALATGRGFSLGHVLLLHDVTEQRRSQDLLVEQQRALAASEERDRLARELHDSLGQVLGYVKMQLQAARDLLAKGRAAEADGHLSRLAAVAQDAHADIREYIVATHNVIPREGGLVPALERYVQHCTQQYGMETELLVEPALDATLLDASAAVQLLCIVQEGLTNARKHGKARRARVTLGVVDGCARVSVEDDGIGFDPALPKRARDPGFGTSFMHERAESVGGSVRVDSAPGAGTRVFVSMPLRRGSP